jgi:hypothetical protein
MRATMKDSKEGKGSKQDAGMNMVSTALRGGNQDSDVHLGRLIPHTVKTLRCALLRS